MTRTQTALVGAGGAAGAVLRWAISTLDASAFPWPTLLVNLLGAAILGVLLVPGALSSWSGGGSLEDRRALLATGFCGGLTTMSTFSVEVVQLVNGGNAGTARWYGALSILGGLGVFWAARTLTRHRLARA